MKNLGLVILFLLFFHISHSQHGEITGVISDTTLNMNLEYAAISVENSMNYITGMSNEHGVYYINPVPPGTYKVTVAYMYSSFVRENVVVYEDQTTELDFLVSSAVGIDSIIITNDPHEDLLNPYEPDIGFSLKDKGLVNKPVREIEDIVRDAPFIFVEGDQIHIKGARPEATKVIIDGMAIMHSDVNIPVAAIRKIDVLSGSIPAKYGDAIGGFIVIETKGF